MTGLSLRRNFAWTLAGNVVYAGSQWGILVVLAKLGTPEMVGQFALGLAVCAPVIMFANLQLRAVQATDARREYTFGDYLGLRLATTGLAYAAIVVITLASGYRAETAAVILLIGLAKAFEAVSDIYFGLLQQRERMDRIGKSLMIEGPATLAVMAVILAATRNVAYATAGMAAVWGLQLWLYDMRSGRMVSSGDAHPPAPSPLRWATGNDPHPPAPSPLRWGGEETPPLAVPRQQGGGEASGLRPRWQRGVMRKLAWLALPLGVVMGLISLNANIPRYFIETNLGQRELGIFAAMAYLMVAGNTVVQALGQATTPRLAKHYAAGNAIEFRRLMTRLIGFGIVIGAGVILVVALAGRDILRILYTPEYAEYHDVFKWVALAAAIGYVGTFLGYGITATRAFKKLTIPYSIITGVLMISSAILVPRYGLTGSAWTLGITSVLQIIMPILIWTGLRRSIEQTARTAH